MKGMVFTEFLDMVDDRFGLETKLRLVDAAQSAHGGAYTAVGNYDHKEMVRMVIALGEKAGVPVRDLLIAFGEHLFGMFVRRYGHFFTDAKGSMDFLARIEDYIHVEVRKLYPDAELPTFHYPPSSPGTLVMDYSSPRPLAAFAEGLVRATLKHFNDGVQVAVEDTSGGTGTSARFVLSRA